MPCVEYTDRSLAMRVRLPRLRPMALFLWEKVKVWWLAPLHVVAVAGAGSPHDGDVAAQSHNGAVADPANREDPELDLLACREAINRERGDIGAGADRVAP